MAKIIRKGHQLEQEYYAIKQEQADNRTKNIRTLCKATFAFFMIYVAAIMVSVITGTFSIAFLPLTVCLVFALLIAVFVCLGDSISKHADEDILVSGMCGEKITTKVLATLPSDYTVFQNIRVTYGVKKSEIDNIVVGRSGVFIVEVKNHNGHIVGDLKDLYWTQHKVGRGGTPYTNKVYNPVKQVGTHIYCLANYLRQNGVNTYIEGMVYFVNKSCLVSLTGESAISVYVSSDNDEFGLCRRILSGVHNLDFENINNICELINQL